MPPKKAAVAPMPGGMKPKKAMMPKAAMPFKKGGKAKGC
jgi:hypothetical protein